jgi:hypothetical protein
LKNIEPIFSSLSTELSPHRRPLLREKVAHLSLTLIRRVGGLCKEMIPLGLTPRKWRGQRSLSEGISPEKIRARSLLKKIIERNRQTLRRGGYLKGSRFYPLSPSRKASIERRSEDAQKQLALLEEEIRLAQPFKIEKVLDHPISRNISSVLPFAGVPDIGPFSRGLSQSLKTYRAYRSSAIRGNSLGMRCRKSAQVLLKWQTLEITKRIALMLLIAAATS